MKAIVLSSLGRQIVFPAPFYLHTAKQGEYWHCLWELCPPLLLLCRGINNLSPVLSLDMYIGSLAVRDLLSAAS